MKKILLILCLALAQMNTFAQAPVIQWQKAFGGLGNDRANSIQATPDGSYIVAGYTTSADGDVTGNHGGGDAWVMKLDAAGTIVWQKAFGGTGLDSAQSIQLTPDGGYIVAGDSNSTDGDVTGNHGGGDAWVMKLDATGTIVWQKTFGGTRLDSAQSIQLTPDGGYIVAGYTSSNDGNVTGYHGGFSLCGNFGSQVCPNNDAWVMKLGPTGTLVWQKAFGGTGLDSAQSIQLTPDGGYIVAGYSNSTDGDGAGNYIYNGYTQAWVVKLNTTGAIIWQKTFGGQGYGPVSAKSIQPTLDGGYIVAGYITPYNNDAWVVKLDAIGAVQWGRSLGGTQLDVAESIQPTNDGGYIVAGYTTSGDVAVNHPYNGYSDAWIVKLSNLGVIEWQKASGGTGNDVAYSIIPTLDGGYIVAGYTTSTDGDVIGNHGGDDAWVVKLGYGLSTTAFKVQELKLYPNPAKNIVHLQTNTNVSLDKITITDLTGNTVLVQDQNSNQINVEKLARGMYILHVFSGENMFTSKFVKE
jgi:hypothetical protein